LQAIDKITYSTYWITIVFVVLLGGVVLLKLLNEQKLMQRFYAIFNFTFIEDELEDGYKYLTPFEVVMFIFSATTLTILLAYLALYMEGKHKITFTLFLEVYGVVFLYFLTKRVLEFALVRLFLVQKKLLTFLNSKNHYLHSISFLIFILLVFYEYTDFKSIALFFFSFFLFVFRFLLFFIRNKKLIFNKLFYFILYICAFEIAPLFILFNLMF